MGELMYQPCRVTCINITNRRNILNLCINLQKYVGLANSLEGLLPQVPLYKISEGHEPCFFTTYFSWDPATATNANRSNRTNQGGNTQRASALAALSSAFNPSSDDKHYSSPTKSNGSNQRTPGTSTQRASALAALSSAFNSSSEKRSVSPRISFTSQGSQRADALAALSPSFTVEKKSGRTPDASPVQVGQSPSPLVRAAPAESITPGVAEKESEPKQQENQKENAFEGSQSTFSYEQLRAKSDNSVTGIDFKHREAYLSGEEFKTLFGITKEESYKLPKWKQDMQKKKLDLF